MRRLGLGVAAAVLVGSTLSGIAPASASCAAPNIRINPTEGASGSVVTVTGDAFGDNCFDTGPPPPGQGALGHPLTGIEIDFTQGGVTTTLATVDASDEYSFAVAITVPPDAALGPAAISTSNPVSYPEQVEFTVTAAAAAPIDAAPSFTG